MLHTDAASGFSMTLFARPLAAEEGHIKVYSRIVVPIDGSELAEQVLPHVVGLSRALGGLPVTLIQVAHSPLPHHGLPEDFGYAEEILKEVEAKATEYLNEVGRKLRDQGVPSVEQRVVRGDIAENILQVVRESPESLVAMASHGRSGLARWALGSVTERVVRHSVGPTLVIRATEEE